MYEYMKEVKHYVCEICGTEYNDKPKCTACERGHKKPVRIIKSKYHPITSNALGIPSTIEVEFENGSKFEYKR